MSSANSRAKAAKLAAKPGSGRLFFMDLAAGRILTSNPDGSDLQTIVNEGRKLPDGIVVDVAGGHIYWTNMGNPKANDGTIDRADLDGTNVTNIVPSGSDLDSQATSARREEPQTLLVGPRRHASHALESRRLKYRNARGNGAWRCRPA